MGMNHPPLKCMYVPLYFQLKNQNTIHYPGNLLTMFTQKTTITIDYTLINYELLS